MEKKTEGDLTCLAVAGTRADRLVWSTDIGPFAVRIIPGLHMAELRPEDAAIISSSLIKAISNQLRAKPLPLPQ
jgi:hypothetical protein